MKVLALTRYGLLGASSRIRTHQYIIYMAAYGIEVIESPLFSDSYILSLQQGKKRIIEVLIAYPKRILALLKSDNYDFLWIEKELLPWLPSFLEEILLPKKIPYILDYDDAVYHYYDQHSCYTIRNIFKNKHKNLIRNAAVVTVGNDYLAKFAIESDAKQVEIIPTVIDLKRYTIQTKQINNKSTSVLIGWIGQKSTAHQLLPYKQLFKDITKEGVAKFAAIGINAQELDLPMTTIKWTEENEVNSINTFDIGIMPLLDLPFERGKCGYKLIQYMACGIPVIASPVGVNCQIVEHGINGFLAQTIEEWEEAIRILSSNPELRNKMGLAGRQKVEEKYCLQVTAPKLIDIFKKASNNAL